MTSSEFGVKFDLLSTNSLHISKLQYDKGSGTQDLLTWLIILLVEYLADPHQLAPTNLAPSILDLGKVCSTVSLSARFSPFTLCFSWTLCLHLLYQWCPGCMCGLAASYQGHSWTVRLFSLPSAPKKKSVWICMNDIWVISLCLFIFMCLTHMSHLRCLQPEAFQVEAFGDREHTGTNQPRSRSATAQVERHLELRLTLRRPLVLEAIGNVAKTWVVFSCFSLQSLWDFPI